MKTSAIYTCHVLINTVVWKYFDVKNILWIVLNYEIFSHENFYRSYKLIIKRIFFLYVRR